jgi:hypothetical protein
VPFARDLHPEFGYVGTAPRVLRRLRLVLSFVVLGIVGGASGVALFMASPDFDPGTNANPLGAMALAPAEALIDPKLALPAAQPAPRLADESGANKTDVGSTKPTCRESLGEAQEGECIRARVVRVRPSRAVNEQPLIAAAPIGHRDDPTVVPALPSAPAEGSSWPAAPPEKPSAIPAPTEMAIAEATPADTTPAAEPTPPAPEVTSKKSQPRAHHELRSGRHNNYSYRSSYSSRSSTNLQGGYARLW